MFKIVSIQAVSQQLYTENMIRLCLSHYCQGIEYISDPMSLSDDTYGLLLRQLKGEYEADPSINYRIIPLHFSAIIGGDGHWVSIQLTLKDSQNLEITVIDPLGFNELLNQVVFSQTGDVFNGYHIKMNGHNLQRQQDVTSCGAIVVDDICQLVANQPVKYFEKGAPRLRNAHLKEVKGLQGLLYQELQRVNTSAVILPKAPELTTELEQVILHVNVLVSNQSESFDALVQSERAPELKQIIFLLDDLAPLRPLLFNIDHVGDDGEGDCPFKEDAMTNLSFAISLFRDDNERSPLYRLRKNVSELVEVDSDYVSNRLERCLDKFNTKSGRELLESLDNLKEIYRSRCKKYPGYAIEFFIVGSLRELCDFSLELTIEKIKCLNKQVRDFKNDQKMSIDELWSIILAEKETLVPYVHCVNQFEKIKSIEGVNFEEALFVFLNISSEIVTYNHLIQQQEYRRKAIEDAYSKIPQTDRDRYQNDADDCWNSFSVWIELFRDSVKAFSLIACYELRSYDRLRKDDAWISVEDKHIIETHLLDLDPKKSADFVLSYMNRYFNESYNDLRKEINQTVSSFRIQLSKEDGAEASENPHKRHKPNQ